MAAIKKLTYIIGALLVTATAASAQTSTPDRAYGLDPYKPSDAALLRTYASALVAQTSVQDLATLDPYNPTDAALLRAAGGGIPIWPIDWFFPGATFGPLLPPFMRHAPAPPMVVPAPGAPMNAAPQQPDAAAAPSSASRSTSVVMLDRPLANDGVSIRYDNRVWISAGKAVALDETFTRAGQTGNTPVFRRTGSTGDVIYVSMRENMVAPFRLRP